MQQEHDSINEHYGVMTSLVYRFGIQLEARISSQTLWSSGKRKRGEWTCADCRNRGGLRQRRAYSDDSMSIGSNAYPFASTDAEERNAEERAPLRRVPARKGAIRKDKAMARGWGLAPSTSTSTAPPPTDAVANAAVNDTGEQRQTELWEQFEQSDDGTSATGETWQGAASATRRSDYNPRYEVEPDFDYAATLSTAIQDQSPDMVARCLVAAERNHDLNFIRSLSDSTFTDCIRLLQPCNMTERLATAHLEISGALAKMMGISSMRRIAWEHSRMLDVILAIRRSAESKLSLGDYRMLLGAARDLGHRKMAVRLWTQMREDGLAPDLECYNSYMGASILNGMFDTKSRQRVRVIPFHMLARRQTKLGAPFATYRVGEGGLKAEVLRALGDMLQNGITADEESFRTVITGAAREGDIDTVKGVLKRIWGVDVDILLSGQDDGATLTPKKIERSSPLCPTQKLLFTIAHAFGINNDVPAALRTVDYVARHFDLRIDVATWAQLFEWTFVLATPRTGIAAQTDGSRSGQLPLPSVLSLWDTMTSAPYHVEPTMGMYNHLIRNLQERDMTSTLVYKMYEGRQLYKTERRRERFALKALRLAMGADATDAERAPADPLMAASKAELAHLRREWEHLALVARRNLFWLKRWLRLFLSESPSRMHIDHSGDWPLRHIPEILWDWRSYAPNVVRYETVAGYVELQFRTKEEIDSNRGRATAEEESRAMVLDRVPLGIGEWWVRKRSQAERVDEARREPARREFETWS